MIVKGFYCRICNSDDLNKGSYPNLHYNNKVFEYYKCKTCNSYNIYPSPNDEDLSIIYKEDQSYLKKIKGNLNFNFNYPFGDYQGYQIHFLNEIKDQLQNKTLLDFACGSGFYMKYAQQFGAKTIGVEFGIDFIKLLNEKTGLEILSFENALQKYENKPFDFIHLGHVLEHLVNPALTMETLKKLAHKDTVFIIDGPLEKNACLSRWYVDFGSKIKGKKYIELAPQHLTLTNKESQLLFFERVGLKKEQYTIVEQFFPLPSSL